jgi:Nucleotidyl transferase AbiEii toxin, Type IV TA system
VRRLGSQQLSKNVIRAAGKQGIAVDRLRRWIGANALLQTLANASSLTATSFLVKGGYSVELRFPARARASEDIDIAIVGSADNVATMREFLEKGWSDFTFEIKDTGVRPNSIRLNVQVRFNGANWCTLKIDLVDEDNPITENVEPPDVTDLGLPPMNPIPCLSRAQQQAQWIHAITKPAAEGERRNRARNLLDLYIFDTHAAADDAETLDATLRVFAEQRTHEFTLDQMRVPEDWIPTLDELIQDLGADLSSRDLVENFYAFLNRITGADMRKNYEYLFITMTPAQNVPTVLESPFDLTSVEYQNFNRLTKTQGYRVSSIMQYPGSGRALLVTLEREVEEQ